MTNQAAAEYNAAVTLYNDAIKRLDRYGLVFKRLRESSLPVEKWNLSKSEDLRYEGGIMPDDGSYGSGGLPLTFFTWPTFEGVVAAIKDRDKGIADRDAAAEKLRALGLDPAGWKQSLA